MATKKVKKEADGVYLLKLVLYLILGSQWVRITDPELTKQIALPMGLFIGLLFTRHEHFQIDRKIEYAILLISCLVGFWAQTGISLTIL